MDRERQTQQNTLLDAPLSSPNATTFQETGPTEAGTDVYAAWEKREAVRLLVQQLEARAVSVQAVPSLIAPASMSSTRNNITLEKLLPRLRRLAHREKRRRKVREVSKDILTWAIALWYGIGVSNWKHFDWWQLSRWQFWVPLMVASWVASLVVGIVIAPFLRVRSRRDQRYIRDLSEFNDIRAIGPLAESLEFHKSSLTKIAEGALTQLLPQMKASDAGLLSKEQRGYLHRALNSKNSEFVFAILTALEQVGDADAIPFVQKLANGEGQAKKNPKLQDAAERCLSFLSERAQYQGARETLLRASVPQSAAPATLLRPAASVADSAPELLLRPNASGSSAEAQTSAGS